MDSLYFPIKDLRTACNDQEMAIEKEYGNVDVERLNSSHWYDIKQTFAHIILLSENYHDNQFLTFF